MPFQKKLNDCAALKLCKGIDFDEFNWPAGLRNSVKFALSWKYKF